MFGFKRHQRQFCFVFQTNNSNHMSSAATMRFRSPNFLESHQPTSNGPLGLNNDEFPSLGGAFGAASQSGWWLDIVKQCVERPILFLNKNF